MKQISIVKYAPGKTSLTESTVGVLKEILEGDSKRDIYTYNEIDLLENPPLLFDKISLNAYVERNYKKNLGENNEHNDQLAQMDWHYDQIKDSSLLVIAFPVYNFMMPAHVKAWVDNIAQAGKSFHYGAYGPEGLLGIERAIVIISSGSVKLGSSKDFISPYIKFVLNFVGIKEVHFTGVTESNRYADKAAKILEVKSELERLL